MNKSLILIGLIFTAYIFYSESIGKNKTENFVKNGNDIKNLNDLKSYIQKIIYKYNFQITVPMVLAVISQETSLKTFDNNIVGDSTKQHKSYGIMQVSVPAFSDSVNTYNLNISESDLKTDLKSNILAGMSYLNICYKRAIKETDPNNVVWFTFKKYNGGQGIKITTYNSSDVYADQVYKKFLELNK